MQGTPMRLDVHGGGVVDAKAYKGWPGVVFNSKAHLCIHKHRAPKHM